MGVLATVALLGACVAGVVLAAPLLEGAVPVRLVPSGSETAAVGTAVRTTFGSLTVTGTEVHDGLSRADLGGMSHGVSSLVSAGSIEVTVVLTLTNDTDAPQEVALSAFRLVTVPDADAGPGATDPLVGHRTVAPAATTLGRSALPAHSSVDARVAFVTPADGARLWVELADGDHTVRVPLGRAPRTSPEGHDAGHADAPGLPVPADAHEH